MFLLQAAHVQGLINRGGRVQLPLAIWTVARAALWLSLVAAALGVLAAFLGWAEVSREQGKYSGGRWVAMALLGAVAWVWLALACYAMGYGFVFSG